MKKASFLDTRAAGAAALVLAIVVGVFAIGGAKVKGLGKEATAYYNENIKAEMDTRVSDAKVLVQQGRQTLAADDAALTTAESALEEMEQANGPGETLAANTTLTAAVGQLYETLRKTVSDDKGSVLQTTWSDFLSRQNIIEFNYLDEYNTLAETAQRKASGFPASMLAKMVGFSV